MNNMADSIAQAPVLTADSGSTNWKTWVGGSIAVLMGVLWIVAGGWKTTNPYTFAALVTQLKVPSTLSLPFAAVDAREGVRTN